MTVLVMIVAILTTLFCPSSQAGAKSTQFKLKACSAFKKIQCTIMIMLSYRGNRCTSERDFHEA